MIDNFRFSRFIFSSEIEGVLHLWQTLTQAIDEIEPQFRRDWERALLVKSLATLPPPFLPGGQYWPYLLKRGYIVPKGRNEKQQIIRLVNKTNSSPSWYICMALGLICNFRCNNCFELMSGAFMTPAVVAKIKKFLTYVISTKPKLIDVDWFGGEPLHPRLWPILQEIYYFLADLCDKSGVGLQQGPTTNGWYLTSGKIKFFNQSQGFKELMITLEGGPDIHNHYRPSRNGKGTFNRILSNAISAVEAGLKVILRVNIRPETWERIPELFPILGEVGLTNQVKLVFKGIGAPDWESGKSEEFLVGEQLSHALIWLYTEAIRAGWKFRPEKFIKPGNFGCSELHLNSVVVGPGGGLSKCAEFGVDQSSENIGIISSNGKPQFNDMYKIWTQQIFGDQIEECWQKECPFIPLDPGGCYRKKINNQKMCGDMLHEPHRFLELVKLTLG